MLKTLKAKTAVIPTIFKLQHGHMSILYQKTQGFRILSQARLARANAMMVRYYSSYRNPKKVKVLRVNQKNAKITP